ncbi:hypothetical protein T484DRAFT_1792573 [Baffinella frigidus]|nr:hypothetical protein T484DRAFT_1792573 [Cryptophyta sp. CCMP2293]
MAPEKKGLLSMAAGDAPRRSDYHSIETEEGAGGERDAAAQRDAPGDAFAGGQLGAKTLGLWSSIVIVAGPGMLVLPRVFQEAGWVVPTLVLIFICIGSSLVTLFLIDAMARIPGNSEFQKRIEFVNVFEHYWGKKGMALAQTLFLFVNVFEHYWGKKGMALAQTLFLVNMLAQIVSSIVSNAQVMDGFIIFANPWHTTYALQL